MALDWSLPPAPTYRGPEIPLAICWLLKDSYHPHRWQVLGQRFMDWKVCEQEVL